MKKPPLNIVSNKYDVKFFLIASLLFLILVPTVLADNPYKPYLHKANVPDYPKVKLYGSYATELFPGAATYSYPLEVPLGTLGLAPSLSIDYNSQTIEQRPGILGAGWRMTQNYIYRDVNSTLNDTSDDSFKLILDSISYDLVYVPSDGFYHTKIESFIRVQQLSGASNSYGSYWLVTLRDGTKYRFGFNQDSELTSDTGKNYVLKWSLDQVEDTHSNKIFFSYLEDPNPDDKGSVYLSKIEYNNDKQRKIQFTYEASVRPDLRTVYEQGNILSESRRLINIDIYAKDVLVRKYAFEYIDLNPEKSLTSLSKIKYFGSDGTSMLHQISFEYYPSAAGFTQQTSQWISPTSFSYDDNDHGVRLIDLNRDGFVDIIKSRQRYNENKVWINDKNGGWIDASSTWSLPVWITIYDSTKSKNFFEERLFGAIPAYTVGGLLRQTCPATFNGEAVEGCDIIKQDYNNYIVIADIEPNEEWIRCYYGDLTNDLYSRCCNGTTMVNPQSGYAFGCCEPGKIRYETFNGVPNYPLCDGDANHLYPTVGGIFNIDFYFLIKPYKLVEMDNGARFVDFNNDGLVDILQGIDGTRKAWMNNGNGWTDVSSIWAPPFDFANSYKDQGVQLIDFNGDGRVDMIQATDNSGTVTKKAFMNKGSGWTDVSSSWQSPVIFLKDNKDTGVRFEEINGDGLVDILFANDTARKAWLNSGSGWVDAPLWYPPSASTFVSNTSRDGGVRFTDVNGDGLVDILEDYANGTATDRGAWINNGHGWTYSVAWQSPEPFTKDGKNIGRRLADINGDSFADIMVGLSNSTGNYTWTWLRSQNTPFVLKKIINELGGLTSLNYQPSTVFNNNGGDSLSDIGFNIWIVGSVNQDNAMTNLFKVTSSTSYLYSNGSYDYQDFEFRGFGKVKETLPDNNYVNHYFYQDDERKGKEYRTEIYSSNGNIFSKVENMFDITSANGISKVLLSSRTNYLHDGVLENPKTTKVSYSYDNYGNVIEKFLQGDVNVADDDKYEKYSYATNTNAWIANKLIEYQLLASDKTTKVKDIMYSYDGFAFGDGVSKGDVTQVETWVNPSSGERHIVKYDYDSYGNLIRTTDPLGKISSYGFGARDTTFTYPDYSANALSQRDDYMYDLGTGNLLWATKSGINRTFYYDAFGRIVKEVQPPDSSTSPTKSYIYMFDGIPPEIIKVTSLASANKTYDIYNYYDGFGNPVQFKEPADGNQQIIKNFFYDGLGRVIREQNPYFDLFSIDLSVPSVVATSSNYNYDPLGRVVSVLNPDGTSKTINFNRNTITAYDENGHRRSYVLDAHDRIVKVIEYNNNPALNQNFETDIYTTYYAYDTQDNLVDIVDNIGNIYSFIYDSLGRRIASVNPDSGNWTFYYDLAGNLLTKKQQGTGNLVTGDGLYREYNALNQLIRIRNGTTPTSPIIENYTYDPFGNRIKIEKNDSAKTKIYIPFKEFMMIKNTSGTYNFTYVYQGDTLVARVNPDGSKYYYHSDELGSTSLITNSNGNAIENIFYSPYGEVLDDSKIEKKLYTGYYKDLECQYYSGSRYFNPCIGRFVQPDVVMQNVYNPQSLNTYSYAGNNPYNRIDKNGRFWNFVAGALIGAGIGAGINIAAQVGGGMLRGQTFWEAASNVNWWEVGVSAGVGALSGVLTMGLGSLTTSTALSTSSTAVKTAVTFGISFATNFGLSQVATAGTNVVRGEPVTKNLFTVESAVTSLVFAALQTTASVLSTENTNVIAEIEPKPGEAIESPGSIMKTGYVFENNPTVGLQERFDFSFHPFRIDGEAVQVPHINYQIGTTSIENGKYVISLKNIFNGGLGYAHAIPIDVDYYDIIGSIIDVIKLGG